MEVNQNTASITNMSRTSTQAPWVNPNNVDFVVAYSEEYKGVKEMPEGPVNISKESAEHFSNIGIGHIMTDEEKAALLVTAEAIASEDNGDKPNVYSAMSKEELQTELTARAIDFDGRLKEPGLIKLLEADDLNKK